MVKSLVGTKGEGHIIIQTKGMETILLEKENVMQSDTIMSYVRDSQLPSANVTITSTYSLILNCYVPILIAILFGMTAMHYHQYFLVLFECFKFKDFDEFDCKWPGNVCDFSKAERVGFESALCQHFSIPNDKDLIMSKYYSCCEVHLEGSRARVARNHVVVHPSKKSEFDNIDHSLLDKEISMEDFNKQVKKLKKEFPKSKKWIDWYLHECRRSLIFPVFGKVAFSDCGNNTNGQESQGKLIQLSDPLENPSILVCFRHLLRYANNCVDMELSSITTGLITRYHGSRKRKQVNDGRAPDRTSQLSPGSKRLPPGRPRHAKNLAPTKTAVQDLSFGIPWSYSYDGLSVTNTCAMDTALMSLFFIRK